MAIEVPTVWPSAFTAGDTVKFTIERDDYPPSSWTMTYTLVSQSASHTITATDNGDGSHLFSADSATTRGYAPGSYRYFISASDGTDRYTVADGVIAVSPDPTLGAYDSRSHVKKVLDALEARLEGKATDDIMSIEVGGRTLSHWSPSELLTWRDKYVALYVQEQQAARVAAGQGSSRKIKVRFR